MPGRSPPGAGQRLQCVRCTRRMPGASSGCRDRARQRQSLKAETRVQIPGPLDRRPAHGLHPWSQARFWRPGLPQGVSAECKVAASAHDGRGGRSRTRHRAAPRASGSTLGWLLPPPPGADRRSRPVRQRCGLPTRAPAGQTHRRQCASRLPPTPKTRGQERVKTHHKPSQPIIGIQGEPKWRIPAPRAGILRVLRAKKWWTGGELNSRHRGFSPAVEPVPSTC
jgi:hypothetical protein